MSLAEIKLREGDLGGARAELVDLVKKAPGNVDARMFLFQLLCLTAEWTKARAQLSALAQLSPEAQMLSVAYNQAIDAEITRADAFAGRAPVALLTKSSPWSQDLVTALGHDLAGRADEAEAARARAFDAAPDTPGTFNDTAFDWIADADTRFGPAVEAIVAGKWGLLPFDTLDYIKSDGPKDLRDTVWLPVQIGFKSGQSIAGFLPVRYPGTETCENTAAILARSTDWIDDAPVGQHVLNLSGGEEMDLLSLRALRFGS